MNDRLQDIIDTFRSVDEELRLELLLDYSRRLPALPDRLRAQRDAGLNRVPECMTPVFLFVERDGADSDHVRLFIDVADEAPTVRGMLGIIVAAYDGARAGEIGDLPADLVNRLGLGGAIRMNRLVGLSAILQRIRNEAVAAVTA
ncbi:MAG: SufE family protein [Planctomycetota bacterium]|nr:SufE family protein [Planctomycetota bacterium]